MRKLLLFPASALLLAGCDFSGDSDSATAPIASLQIENVIPSPDPDGSGQDVFFEIQNATGRSFYRSAIQYDTDLEDGRFEAAIAGGVEIPSATMALQVAFFDADGGDLAFAQQVAISERFTVADLTADEDGSVSLAAQGGPAQFTVVRSAQ